MSLLYKSLSGLDPIGAGELQNNHRITVITASGMQNVTWGNLSQAIVAPLESRILALEEAGSGEEGVPGPSIWPVARTLTLTGAVAGAVAMDGSQNVSMSTVIEDGSLTMAKVNGLQAKLNELTTAVGYQWGTGYTNGPSPTAFGGNLNVLSGATYLYTQAGATNVPATGDPFLILQNGPQNFGQQLALRNGSVWVRGQNMGNWSPWNQIWTTANLDPSLLLLKTDTATAATKLATARAFSLTGLVTATAANFDGTGNLSLTTAIANDALSIAKTSGLQTALDQRMTLRGAAGTASLNTLLASGVYVQATAANVTTANAYPVANEPGILEVYQQGSIITQKYHSATNRVWTRYYDGSSWSTWSRLWSSLDFEPSTKYDKTGGSITGSVSASGSLQAGTHVQGTHLISTIAPGASGNWMVINSSVTGRAKGLSNLPNGISLATLDTVNGTTTHDLRLLDNGQLLFDQQPVYHGGNFDPAAPVPATGVLTVGASNGTRLLLRNDGRYSTNGGTTWRELNEAPQAVTDPRFSTLRIGADDDLHFYEDTPGTLALRTGNSLDYRYFLFEANGNLRVPSGRVLIGSQGHEAWHVGNFTPSNKLDVNATAAAATKLATARTINGVAFDGTQNITLPGSLNPDDYVRVSQTSSASVNPETLGGKLAQTIVASDPTGAPTSYVTVWNFGTGGGRDGQIAWSFGPASEFYMRGRYDQTGGWKAWSRVWTDQTFNPASKLDNRGSLHAQAETTSNWNNATNNGWYMASGAQNAPPGLTASGEWLIGTVTVHNGDWIQQEVWAFTGSPQQPRWRRYKSAGTWGAWTKNQEFGNIMAEPNGANSAIVARLPHAQQAGGLAFYWGANRIWQQGVESNGDWKLWAFTDQGAYKGNPLTITGDGSMGIMMGGVNELTSRFSVNGGIKSYGGAATIALKERDGNDGPEWAQYASHGVWRLWRSGIGDVVTVNTAGGLSASRIAAGWDSGHGGSISCSNWFRTTGQTGIFFADYGGGWHMTDSTFVRAYNGKAVAANWFETTGAHRPDTSSWACGFRTSGGYGGGFGMVDGTRHITMFSIGGTLTFGFGTNGIQAHPAQITAGGVYLGADFQINSDKSLKENIQPLHYRGRLNPVTYDYIDGLKFRMGFLADEVEELYPEAVGRDPVTGKRRLSESMLTSVLAAQANAQGDEIEALQDTVGVLENTVVTLRQELAELKQLVASLRQ